MYQSNRSDLKESYGEVIKKGLRVRNAINVLNACIDGGDSPPTLQQERVAIVIFNKFVPSLQAVAMEIRSEGPASIHDLNAMLLSTGLEALPSPSQQPIDNVEEKVVATQEKSETPAPPDAEA